MRERPGLTVGLDALPRSLTTCPPTTPGPGCSSGAYECIALAGMAKTTVDDVAAASGVSRATIYRLFPGGKDEVLRETVGWEMDRFFLHLGEELGDTPDFPDVPRARPPARPA